MDDTLDKIFKAAEDMAANLSQAIKRNEELEKRIVRLEAEIADMSQANVKLRQDLDATRSRLQDAEQARRNPEADLRVKEKLQNILKKLEGI